MATLDRNDPGAPSSSAVSTILGATVGAPVVSDARFDLWGTRRSQSSVAEEIYTEHYPTDELLRGETVEFKIKAQSDGWIDLSASYIEVDALVAKLDSSGNAVPIYNTETTDGAPPPVVATAAGVAFPDGYMFLQEIKEQRQLPPLTIIEPATRAQACTFFPFRVNHPPGDNTNDNVKFLTIHDNSAYSNPAIPLKDAELFPLSAVAEGFRAAFADAQMADATTASLLTPQSPLARISNPSPVPLRGMLPFLTSSQVRLVHYNGVRGIIITMVRANGPQAINRLQIGGGGFADVYTNENCTGGFPEYWLSGRQDVPPTRLPGNTMYEMQRGVTTKIGDSEFSDWFYFNPTLEAKDSLAMKLTPDMQTDRDNSNTTWETNSGHAVFSDLRTFVNGRDVSDKVENGYDMAAFYRELLSHDSNYTKSDVGRVVGLPPSPYVWEPSPSEASPAQGKGAWKPWDSDGSTSTTPGDRRRSGTQLGAPRHLKLEVGSPRFIVKGNADASCQPLRNIWYQSLQYGGLQFHDKNRRGYPPDRNAQHFNSTDADYQYSLTNVGDPFNVFSPLQIRPGVNDKVRLTFSWLDGDGLGGTRAVDINRLFSEVRPVTDVNQLTIWGASLYGEGVCPGPEGQNTPLYVALDEMIREAINATGTPVASNQYRGHMLTNLGNGRASIQLFFWDGGELLNKEISPPYFNKFDNGIGVPGNIWPWLFGVDPDKDEMLGTVQWGYQGLDSGIPVASSEVPENVTDPIFIVYSLQYEGYLNPKLQLQGRPLDYYVSNGLGARTCTTLTSAIRTDSVESAASEVVAQSYADYISGSRSNQIWVSLFSQSSPGSPVNAFLTDPNFSTIKTALAQPIEPNDFENSYSPIMSPARAGKRGGFSTVERTRTFQIRPQVGIWRQKRLLPPQTEIVLEARKSVYAGRTFHAPKSNTLFIDWEGESVLPGDTKPSIRLYLKRVYPSEVAQQALSEAMFSAPALYPFVRSEIHFGTINDSQNNFLEHALFPGRRPSTVIIAVAREAAVWGRFGDARYDTFRHSPYGTSGEKNSLTAVGPDEVNGIYGRKITECTVRWGGKQFPTGKPVNFSTKAEARRVYEEMIALNTPVGELPAVTEDAFVNSYAFVLINLEDDFSLPGAFSNTDQSSSLDVTVRFEPIPAAIIERSAKDAVRPATSGQIVQNSTVFILALKNAVMSISGAGAVRVEE